MSFLRGTVNLTSVFNSNASLNQIMNTGLKSTSNYIIVDKNYTSASSDNVGIVYVYARDTENGPLSGSFSTSTVTTDTGLTIPSGSIINIVGAKSEKNNNLFEVASYSSITGLITINTSPVEFFTKGIFTSELATGSFTIANVLVRKVNNGIIL